MAKTQKPKAKTSERSDRANGKAPKKNPKVGNENLNGKTVSGYTQAAMDRRVSIRNLTFEGMLTPKTARKRIKRKP